MFRRSSDSKDNARTLDNLCSYKLSVFPSQLFPLTQYRRCQLRTGQDKLDHLYIKIQNQLEIIPLY